MASATGIPEQRIASTEDEPLLGRPGDASQQEGQGLQYNFVLGESSLFKLSGHRIKSFAGTGMLAQAGTWIVSLI
jgi:hypothetical protein